MYPYYHMLKNLQNILGLPAPKIYGKMRVVRVEALSWLKIVDNVDNIARISSILKYQTSQFMDYITIYIIQPTIAIPISLSTLVR